MDQKSPHLRRNCRSLEIGQVMSEYLIVVAITVGSLYLVLVRGGEIEFGETTLTIPSVTETIAAKENKVHRAMYLPITSTTP
jgi:hypothetical protein